LKPARKGRAALVCGALLLTAAVHAEEFPPERIAVGAAIFARNCSPCHGARMRDPEAAFDLRQFPPDQHDRFVNSVTRGKNQSTKSLRDSPPMAGAYPRAQSPG